jgi:hypothetical protein
MARSLARRLHRSVSATKEPVMNISAATISHALHGLSHHSGTHPRGPVTFGQHLGAAAQQAGGQQAAGPQAASRADNAPGSLLSADLLRQVQAIG